MTAFRKNIFPGIQGGMWRLVDMAISIFSQSHWDTFVIWVWKVWFWSNLGTEALAVSLCLVRRLLQTDIFFSYRSCSLVSLNAWWIVWRVHDLLTVDHEFHDLIPFFLEDQKWNYFEWSSQFEPFNSRTSKTSIHSTVHWTMLPAFMIRRRRNSRTPKYRLSEVISICATTDVPPKHVDKKVHLPFEKQRQNVAWSQWLVHLCVINLICICTDALLCQHAWAEHGPYLFLPPSHTDKSSFTAVALQGCL